MGGTVAFLFIGAGVAYVLCNNKRIPFSEWVKNATKEELEIAHEKMRLEFCKTGIKSGEKELISRELGERGTKEWFEKHPNSYNPNFRWTDANRWDKD